ncbi:hypothetical protein LCY76_16275 [Fictibacillus sp. KIGAM418]|uniref:Uncharacterized protein n=1 Tax=Fictibacillus marinisediminis TaxID=2878389 RepID=A0A9X1XIN2_9BACL|nr:hypothetical protein [Fictibacillus marinisediminis]MCK6258134.1 hypothetical protein [Fictibacillus marinisediminis]
MKKAPQENRLMIVQEISPNLKPRIDLAAIFKLPVFMKTFVHKPPDLIEKVPGTFQK